MFPKAHELMLRRLLDVLSERVGSEESEKLLRAVGQRLAEGQTVPEDGVRARLKAAVSVFNKLGGLAELKERDGTFVIRGYSCPLATVVPGHPEVCRMGETLLTELAGVPIYEHCDRGERPRCCFEVALPEDIRQR